MNRKSFLKSLGLLAAAGSSVKLAALHNYTSSLGSTKPMPALFLGHGSPMNAIEENEFVANFRNLGRSLPTPRAILCISAHWETSGTYVTAMASPRTIHDFGGFPQQLFDVQYPAPGSPELVEETAATVTKTNIQLDHKWGLDHGAWSVIKHLYPKADIPVVQLSLDYSKKADYHYQLAQELSVLRRKGVLIIGSGNMVHNLRMVDWDKLNTPNYGYDWALEADEKMRKLIHAHEHDKLIAFREQGKAFDLAIPTPEHYLPLIYTLALRGKNDEVSFFNDQAVGGALTMTSVLLSPELS